MKRLATLSIILLLTGCSQPAPPEGNTLQRLDPTQYQGRWLVVNYWAQWCKPCIKEIPELSALDSMYPQVAVLGVNFDGATGAELQAQMDKFGMTFPVILEDPSVLFGLDKPSVLPTTLILNPDGILVHNLAGPQTLESLALLTGQVDISQENPTEEHLIEVEQSD